MEYLLYLNYLVHLKYLKYLPPLPGVRCYSTCWSREQTPAAREEHWGALHFTGLLLEEPPGLQ